MKTKLLKKLRKEARRVKLSIPKEDRVRIHVNSWHMGAYFLREGKKHGTYRYDTKELRETVQRFRREYMEKRARDFKGEDFEHECLAFTIRQIENEIRNER